ncbi:MAG TPA: xanthine dehydrogenase family protein molybdopterin-binding subunit [Candidatus Dormibacteraeota bacterium]
MIGTPQKRREDPKLIRGEGRYAGDLHPDHLAHLVVVRSPLPHARIVSIDADAARAMPGVLAVWTAADLPAAAKHVLEQAPRGVPELPRPVLVEAETCAVGEPLVAVFAEDRYQASDAAQAVFVDLDPLPAVATVQAASATGAPPAHTQLETNVQGARQIKFGDVDAAFAADSVVARATLFASRIAGAAMEPRAYTSVWDADVERLTHWSSTQFVFGVRMQLAQALGLDQSDVDVRAEDVGGGFGPKGQVYPEEILVALGARQLRRAVQFVAARSEDTVTTVQGHGTLFELELAADPEGRLRGFRGRIFHDIGANSGAGAGQPSLFSSHMVSAYRLPALEMNTNVVFTNAGPTGFVRGGGRPLGNYAIERMMDRLALELGLDPAELRRRNLIQPDEFPYDTHYPAGGGSTVQYDGGDYPRLLELALSRLDFENIERPAGKLIGRGVACCVESTGFGSNEPAKVRIEKDGVARLFIGSTPQGQGHLTIAAQVLSERLGWPLDKIEVSAGDTRQVPFALLTAGSRTAVHVGNAVALAGATTRRRLLESAAEVMEASPADLVLEDGQIAVRGAPQSARPVTDVIPEDGLEVLEVFDPPMPTAYSSGVHAAAVAVDPETGAVDILRYVIVHDTGKAINPRLVEGQMHGGWVHGLGYALFEESVYQPDGGFQSSTFLDYSIAGAPEVGEPILEHIQTATEANPEGFKGAGESGTIPVPATIANAVEDALRQVKPDVIVDSIPVTPLSISRLLAG